MWGYIDEQINVLTNILKQEEETLSVIPDEFRDKQEVIITASGSSLNGAMIVKALIEKETSKRVTIESPFQIRYYSQLLKNNAKDKLLIVLSQTGKSIGTLECVKLANENKIATLAMTAYDESPIAKESNVHINIMCGDESVGPKTKGFTATVLTLHLTLLNLFGINNYQEIIEDYKKSILELPKNINDSKQWCENHKEWASAKAMSIVGFGANNATAREGALKVLETMQIPVMNFEMEEFMHGPHRTIIEGSYLIVIDHEGSGHDLMTNLIQFSKTKTQNYVVISSVEKTEKDTIHIGSYPLISSWLNAVIPFQIMCTYFPEVNGINSSDPVYGNFATTVGTRIA